ncbi:ABC transporter permease [Pseudooceanicola sp. CBS1P-1]|uniref:ABC transporter permease subunit n=1 Tax=Pseudooceanicola albus TaxID=2692189 RepID=A0A6L7FZ84_9RHOB|nr:MULTISPECIES: ABC transporter permease [Pseudooceanicola]MBT9383968.1 ABC transporter permease [Pseudooceanicola endophyticus]MXN16620.1 ABC transporter permease subunit [Pseudooceanicola albus]
MRQRTAILLLLPAAILLTVFLAVPYVTVITSAFRTPGEGTPFGEGYTLGNFGRIFSQWYYIGQALNTMLIGAITTLVTLLIALPVAFQLARPKLFLRGLAYGIVLSPLLVGIVIRSYGWTILLGNNGVINRTLRDWGLIDHPLPLMYNTLGIIIALTHVFLPFMILPIMSAVQGIDPSVPAAARSLGAKRFTVIRRVLLPLAMPGIQSGCILVFVLSLSSYVTPALIGGFRVKTTAVTVVDAMLDTFQWPFGAALALTLAVVGGGTVLIFARLTRIKWKT